jgi:hypothetical protein
MHAPANTGALDWDSDDEYEIGVMVVAKDASTNKRQHKHMPARSTSFRQPALVRPLQPVKPSQAYTQRHESPTAETSESVERGNVGVTPQFAPSIQIGTISSEQINLRGKTPKALESSTLPPITLVGGDLIYFYNGKPSPVKGEELAVRGAPHAQPSSVPSDQLEAPREVLGAQPDEQKLSVPLRPSRLKRIGGGNGDTAGRGHEIMAPSFELDSNQLPKPVREWTRIVGDDAENGELTALPAPIREWTEVEDRKQSDKASTGAEHELRSGSQGPDPLPQPAFSPPADGTSHARSRTQPRSSPALQARIERARQLHEGGDGSAGGAPLHTRDGGGAAGPRAVAGRWVDPAKGRLSYREPTPMVAHLPLLSTSLSEERSDRPGSPDKEGLGVHAKGSRSTSVPLSTVEHGLLPGREGRGRSHGCDEIWIADAVEGGDDK